VVGPFGSSSVTEPQNRFTPFYS